MSIAAIWPRQFRKILNADVRPPFASPTAATGSNAVFEAPSDWVDGLVNGTIGSASSSGDGLPFDYVPSGVSPTGTNYFTISASPSFPTGYRATFSSNPVAGVVTFRYANPVQVSIWK